MRIGEVRKALVELKEKRQNGELTSFAYDRQKERILQKAQLDEESGERHRYPTRRRLGLVQQQEPLTKKKEKEKEEFVVFSMDDFIDDRNSSEYSVELDTDDIETSSSGREEHHFPKEIVIDCTSLRKTGKPITFPANFFKQVIQ